MINVKFRTLSRSNVNVQNFVYIHCECETSTKKKLLCHETQYTLIPTHKQTYINHKQNTYARCIVIHVIDICHSYNKNNNNKSEMSLKYSYYICIMYCLLCLTASLAQLSLLLSSRTDARLIDSNCDCSQLSLLLLILIDL